MLGELSKERRMYFSIQKELFDILPDLTIGMVVAIGVDNTYLSKEINDLLTQGIEELRRNLTVDRVQEHPRIKPWRGIHSHARRAPFQI
jgi:DNA/RNA-binding domain of Phe-tRNA-synthetase-like protein